MYCSMQAVQKGTLEEEEVEEEEEEEEEAPADEDSSGHPAFERGKIPGLQADRSFTRGYC